MLVITRGYRLWDIDVLHLKFSVLFYLQCPASCGFWHPFWDLPGLHVKFFLPVSRIQGGSMDDNDMAMGSSVASQGVSGSLNTDTSSFAQVIGHVGLLEARNRAVKPMRV